MRRPRIVRTAVNPISIPKELECDHWHSVAFKEGRVHETEVEIAIGETILVGDLEITILDVEEDVTQIQIEPPPGQPELPVRFNMRPQPAPK